MQTCDAAAATAGGITLSGSNAADEEYATEVRCGRALAILEFAAADSSPFNELGDFTMFVSVAVQKVKNLPNLGPLHDEAAQ